MYAKKATVTMFNKEVEVYQLPDGSYHMSKTQMANLIQKRHQSVAEFLQGKSPEALPYKNMFNEDCKKIKIEGNNSTFHSVPMELAYAYWMYWANKGWTPAQNLIVVIGQLDKEEGVQIFGKNFKNNVFFSDKQILKSASKERILQQQINVKLKGLLEVSTPVGKIDILTDKFLIEIKKTKDWKSGIGQLLMYGHYYPKHQKVMCLFDIPTNFDLDLTDYLCKDYNIIITTTIDDFTRLSLAEVH